MSWLDFVLEALQADLLDAENTLFVAVNELFEDLEVVLTDFLILEHVDVERISKDMSFERLKQDHLTRPKHTSPTLIRFYF